MTPCTAAHLDTLSSTNFLSPSTFMLIALVTLSNSLILCRLFSFCLFFSLVGILFGEQNCLYITVCFHSSVISFSICRTTCVPHIGLLPLEDTNCAMGGSEYPTTEGKKEQANHFVSILFLDFVIIPLLCIMVVVERFYNPQDFIADASSW